MKSPRKILLEQHQAADPRLDEIRRAIVADLPGPAGERGIPFVLKLWHELIRPCRRTWAGLAAAWLVIAVFNLSQSGPNAPVSAAKAKAPSDEMRLAAREQRRVLEEIIGPNWSPSPVVRPQLPNPKPRSERRSVGMA